MTLRNATERVVREAVEKRKAHPFPADETGCWCPLCETDIIALTLGTLSPHYCTHFDYERVMDAEESARVGRTLDHSIARVGLHPKHERLVEGAPSPRLRLVNFSCKEGEAIVDSLFENSGDACCCEDCRTDTLAYALNRYPPRYGVERNGIVEMPAREREAIRREISIILTHASRIVTANPRHRGHG